MDNICLSVDESVSISDIDIEKITDFIHRVLNYIDKQDKSLSLLFTDNNTIKDHNRQYRGIDKVTDVLSFSQLEGDEDFIINDFIGDIVISVPYALKKSEELGHSLLEELYFLILHGILHLIGYDHDDEDDDECEMNKLQKDIYFEILGVHIE